MKHDTLNGTWIHRGGRIVKVILVTNTHGTHRHKTKYPKVVVYTDHKGRIESLILDKFYECFTKEDK